MSGTLFLVATPIGNLEDITLRALRVLKEVDLIACEDTRHTRKLLSHFGITTPTVSYHLHNEHPRSRELLAKLAAGQNLALVSDAGTPLVSDPGAGLVKLSIFNTITVVAIPGASAILTALAASGLPLETFHFLGFLPAIQTQRRKLLQSLQSHTDTAVAYEAPHRLLPALADIEDIHGPDRPLVVARELTKLHEEYLRGTVAEIRTQLAGRPSIKGEITLVLGPPPVRQVSTDFDTLPQEVEALIAAGTPRMDAIKEVARRHGLGKRDVYKLIG